MASRRTKTGRRTARARDGAAAVIRKLNAELANRARVERALKASQGRLSVVFNTAAEGIITVDKRGTIDSFNPAAERIFGYSAREVVGRNVAMLMPPAFRENHDRYIADYLRTGVKKVIGIGREVAGVRKDGSIFPMDLAVGEGLDGNDPVFTGVVRDLTGHRERENRLRTAERLAAIGTLAAGLGHDMNNVLLPVRARLNALRAADKARSLKPSERKHIAAIAKSVAYLQQLADGLHFLAMDPEKGDDADARTDLHEWWSQSGPLLAKAVPNHARFSASIPAVLPEIGVAPHQLTQAVLNLLVNAGEAIPPVRKRREGRVRIWARSATDPGHGSCVRLGITDNGEGMSEEVRRRAFEMFFTTKPRGLGTGLGLPLVRKIVEHTGGSIDIDSEVGKGTTVTMTFAARPRRHVPGRGRHDGPAAVVTISDGRAAALVRHILEAGGAHTAVRDDPADCDIWIVEPRAQLVPRAKAWRVRRPHGRLILFGEPAPAFGMTWHDFDPIMIRDRYDLAAVRAALGQALRGP